MAINPQEVADKYRRRAGAARQDWETGVTNVTVAPGQKAAAKKDKWRTNTLEAADRWAENTGKVTLEEWKARALQVGGNRYTTGVEAGAQNYLDYMQEAAPKIEAIQRQVQSMPNNTFEENLQRMVRNATLMRSLKK